MSAPMAVVVGGCEDRVDVKNGVVVLRIASLGELVVMVV